MDFEFHYTTEQEEFRKEVRTFLEEIAYKEPLDVVDPMRVSLEMWNKGRGESAKTRCQGLVCAWL